VQAEAGDGEIKKGEKMSYVDEDDGWEYDQDLLEVCNCCHQECSPGAMENGLCPMCFECTGGMGLQVSEATT